MELTQSMFSSSAAYLKHYAELLSQTMNETAAALDVEPDNEKMLEAVDALRKDAERYRWLRSADNDVSAFMKPNGLGWQMLVGGRLDSAVDAALAAKPAVG